MGRGGLVFSQSLASRPPGCACGLTGRGGSPARHPTGTRRPRGGRRRGRSRGAAAAGPPARPTGSAPRTPPVARPWSTRVSPAKRRRRSAEFQGPGRAHLRRGEPPRERPNEDLVLDLFHVWSGQSSPPLAARPPALTRVVGSTMYCTGASSSRTSATHSFVGAMGALFVCLFVCFCRVSPPRDLGAAGRAHHTRTGPRP